MLKHLVLSRLVKVFMLFFKKKNSLNRVFTTFDYKTVKTYVCNACSLTNNNNNTYTT